MIGSHLEGFVLESNVVREGRPLERIVRDSNLERRTSRSQSPATSPERQRDTVEKEESDFPQIQHVRDTRTFAQVERDSARKVTNGALLAGGVVFAGISIPAAILGAKLFPSQPVPVIVQPPSQNRGN
jgi:hypothetical protein